MLDTTSAKITAMPGPSGWSQVHDFKPEDPGKLSLRGHLFVAIATKRAEGLGGIDTISAGRELISRIHEEYFGDLTLKPFNALKNSVEKVVAEFTENWGEVEIAACSFVDGVVYSAAFGGAEVTVSRQGVLGTILKSSVSGVVSASGYPQEGDVILLATRLFHEKIPQGIVKAALSANTPEEAVENFGPEVRVGGIGSLACVVIKFGKAGEPQIFVQNETPSVANKTKTAEVENKIGTVYRKFTALITAYTQKMPGREIYVKPMVDDETSAQSKKTTFSVALVLLFILGISVVFGIQQKKARDLKAKYQTILVSARNQIDEAISLASISPDRSRELFVDTEAKLKSLEEMNVKDAEIENLKGKIEESRSAILGEYNLPSELFFDLSLLSSGFKGDEISVSSKNIYVLDKSGNKIVKVDLSSKKSGVVAGPSVIESASNLASYEDRAFVVMGDGVYEVSSTKTKVIEKTWQGEAFIKGFAGNLYVLDKSANAIYRYSGLGKGFGTQQAWLSSSSTPDFSQVRQWVVDGSIYVLGSGAKVVKFSLGSPQTFSLKGVLPEIGLVDAIYASEDVEDVYFLDRAGKRIVVTDKKGVYKAQYKAPELAGATKIAVSESDKKIIYLSGDKLFSIELRHI